MESLLLANALVVSLGSLSLAVSALELLPIAETITLATDCVHNVQKGSSWMSEDNVLSFLLAVLTLILQVNA